ncbi:MAG: Hsp20/alpha crystallin family protein [Planctomycetales bacterium]|nr:Hsp20/alpha crystallin family protein [Planctomycetales bacterium]MCA9167857.1 Hsp20/alpha crystallin family protein [Planctomycetales bacterium]
MSRYLKTWRGNGVRPWDDLYKEMDNLVQHFIGEDNGGARDFVPQLNVAENEGGYEVTVDLPGLKPEDVSVEVHENQLTISGKRDSEQQENGKTYHRVERRYGEFRRVVSLPAAVDEAKITAKYEQGVLHVSLPKSEKLKPTRISVQTAG